MTDDTYNVEIETLFVLAQKEDWDTLKERIQHVKNSKILFALSSSSRNNANVDEKGTLLHMLCSSPNIHQDVVEMLLQVAGDELLLVQDALGHTCLHDAFRSGASLAVMKLLITPASARIKDNLCLTPLDHVCERIIMREERHRYNGNEKTDDKTDTYLWECARLLLQALGQDQEQENTRQDETIMMMHACIQASSSCPVALRQRIMKRHAHQLCMADSQGNLPLHVAARNVQDDDEDVEVIQQVLDAHPAAIRAVNNDGNLPLDEAIHAGRMWSNGAAILFQAFPEAILVSEHYRVPQPYLALVLSELGRKGSPDSMYRILHAQPELFTREGR